MQSISAVVIAYNEEAKISQCILSLQKVADEIIVVDSFSTDRTSEICKALGARVVQHPFDNYTAQKNFASSLANFDYILSLDADELLSDELIKSIVAVKSEFSYDAFSMNRRNAYCGEWVWHGGWYPDTKNRLWNKHKGTWKGEKLHEAVVMEPHSTIHKLRGDILHYTIDSIEQHIQQVNRFSSIKADTLKQKSLPLLFFKLFFNPIFRFFRDYFLLLGCLDGFRGFVIALISAFCEFLIYAKAIFYK